MYMYVEDNKTKTLIVFMLGYCRVSFLIGWHILSVFLHFIGELPYFNHVELFAVEKKASCNSVPTSSLKVFLT